MRWWSNLREPVAGLNKAQLQAAVDATDTWIDSNAAAFNAALPLPARTALTATQKTILFVAVTLMRHNQDLLRRIFGEVD
jgi:hypothetical protein